MERLTFSSADEHLSFEIEYLVHKDSVLDERIVDILVND